MRPLLITKYNNKLKRKQGLITVIEIKKQGTVYSEMISLIPTYMQHAGYKSRD